jgi:glycosyltransferase involved in cell wall biosynthesis
VKVVRVPKRPLFNHAEARNTGAAHATAKWLLFADADVVRNPASTWSGPLSEGPADVYLANRGAEDFNKDLSGTVFVTRAFYEKVNGYDQLFRGWGGEDDEFYWRLRRAGATFNSYPPSLFSVIPHTDEERMKFHVVQSRAISKLINKVYLKVKRRLLETDVYLGVFELPVELRERLRLSIEEQLSTLADSGSGSSRSLRLSFDFESMQVGGIKLREQMILAFEVEPVLALGRARE